MHWECWELYYVTIGDCFMADKMISCGFFVLIGLLSHVLRVKRSYNKIYNKNTDSRLIFEFVFFAVGLNGNCKTKEIYGTIFNNKFLGNT